MSYAKLSKSAQARFALTQGKGGYRSGGNTYYGSNPPRLEDDEDEGFRWIPTGTVRAQTNDPKSGSTTHSIQSWERVALAQPPRQQERSESESPYQSSTAMASPSPTSSALWDEAREKAAAYESNRPVAPDLRDSSDGAIFNRIFDYGNQAASNATTRGADLFDARSAAATSSIGDSFRFNLDRLQASVPKPLGPQEIENMTARYGKFAEKGRFV